MGFKAKVAALRCLLVVFSLVGTIRFAHADNDLAYVSEGDNAVETYAYVDRNTYWQESRKGWFWYERELEKKKAEAKRRRKEPREVEVKPAVPAIPEVGGRKLLTNEYLDSMSVEELRDLAEQSKKIAVAKPTKENVHRYVYIQKFMSDKSERFAKVWQVVLLEHPELGELRDASASESGRAYARGDFEDKIKNLINGIADNAALIVFCDPANKYCERQEILISMFEQNHGWFVKRVNTAENTELASTFQVENTPDIWLVYRNQDDTPFYHRIANGFVSLQEIEEKILFVWENVITNPISNPNYVQDQRKNGKKAEEFAPGRFQTDIAYSAKKP